MGACSSGPGPDSASVGGAVLPRSRCTSRGRLAAGSASSSGPARRGQGASGKTALCNSSQAALGTRLSKKAALSASETTIYKLIKFLPLSARLILRVLESVPRLQKLINAYGGTIVRVPLRKSSSDVKLAAVLGVRALERFVAAYGGTSVYIPVCADFLRRLRDIHINREYARLQKQGMSNREAVQSLCRRHSLSESRLRTIVRESYLS